MKSRFFTKKIKNYISRQRIGRFGRLIALRVALNERNQMHYFLDTFFVWKDKFGWVEFYGSIDSHPVNKGEFLQKIECKFYLFWAILIDSVNEFTV